MRRTDRLFEIIQMFRGGRFLRGRDLSERLGVSLRTIYRDIDTLIASGVPIEGERGVGYIMREPIFLPPLTLSVLELEALQLGAQMAARVGDATLAEAAGSLLAKIDAVLPSDRRGRDFSAEIGVYAQRPKGAHEHLPALREAIRSRWKLVLRYRRLDGEITNRTLRPLHLEYWGKVWTLTAWCEARDDFRAFRVDLIEALEVGEPFRPEPGKTFSDYWEREIACKIQQ